jgi:hypothetical protein
MAYVGQGIKGGTFSVLDTSGNTYNGSNVTFNLGTQVGSPAQLLVSHDGVIQKPVTDYTIATGGTQITFTTAPASGASIFITEISGAVGAPMNRDINGDELILDADADTSITADTDDQIDVKVGGSDRFKLDNSGHLSLLTDSAAIKFGADSDVTLTHDPDDGLFLKSIATGDDNPILLTLQTGETDIAASDVIGKIAFQAPDEGTGTDAILVSAAVQAVAEGDHSSSSNATRLEFMTGASEAATSQMTISSGGIVGIGATLPGDLGIGLHIKTSDTGASVNNDGDELVIENGGSGLSGGLTILSATNGYGSINFGDSGDDNIGIVRYDHNSNSLDFFSNGAERMTINDDGNVCVNTAGLGTQGVFQVLGKTSNNIAKFQTGTDDEGIVFNNASGSLVGSVQVGGSSTAFNTSSDYRLKENVDYDFDATTRLKQLKPARFNWIIDDTNTLLDGFLAHEVSSIVPEAITGTKDKVDSEGNPVHQGIDQSKLVPLLVKTIQELEARIKTLEDA